MARTPSAWLAWVHAAMSASLPISEPAGRKCSASSAEVSARPAVRMACVSSTPPTIALRLMRRRGPNDQSGGIIGRPVVAVNRSTICCGHGRVSAGIGT